MATTGAFSDYAENAVLNHLLGTTTLTKPATVYLALCTAAPTDASASNEVTTTAWTNYARKAITFGASASGTITNNALVDYGTVSGTGATITHWAIFDALTAGNMLVRGDFGTGQTASTGNAVTVPSGTLSVSLD